MQMQWKYWVCSIVWEQRQECLSLCAQDKCEVFYPDMVCEIPARCACSLHGTHNGGHDSKMTDKDTVMLECERCLSESFPQGSILGRSHTLSISSPSFLCSTTETILTAQCQEAIEKASSLSSCHTTVPRNHLLITALFLFNEGSSNKDSLWEMPPVPPTETLFSFLSLCYPSLLFQLTQMKPKWKKACLAERGLPGCWLPVVLTGSQEHFWSFSFADTSRL